MDYLYQGVASGKLRNRDRTLGSAMAVHILDGGSSIDPMQKSLLLHGSENPSTCVQSCISCPVAYFDAACQRKRSPQLGPDSVVRYCVVAGTTSHLVENNSSTITDPRQNMEVVVHGSLVGHRGCTVMLVFVQCTWRSKSRPLRRGDPALVNQNYPFSTYPLDRQVVLLVWTSDMVLGSFKTAV
ncbi:hypothetical protein P168DRAFT_288318, partial [Aspergillus campestris IBT 28561]